METATWVVELGVGAACLVGGVVSLRAPRFTIVGIVLVVAGAAAIVHALVQLAD